MPSDGDDQPGIQPGPKCAGIGCDKHYTWYGQLQYFIGCVKIF